MSSASQSIIIEDSPVKQAPSYTETLGIDIAKVDLLSSYSQLMFYLFKASINIGVRDRFKEKQDKKHPVKIQTPSAHSMTKAKNFVKALCSPEIVQSVPVVPKLIEALEKNDYKNNLMREHTVFLSMTKKVSDVHLFIQGQTRDVARAKGVIEKYQISLVSKAQKDDDDVIWLSDSEEVKSNPHPKKEPMGSSGNKTDNFKDNKRNVPTVLMRTATLLGFGQTEIQKVYDEQIATGSGPVDELDFMNKLRQSRLKIRTAELAGTENNASTVKTSATGSGSNLGDIEIIDFDEERMSIGPVINEGTPLVQMETSPALGLKEYGQMFSTHQFESSNLEKENKVKRISALIAAMPSSQQSDAMDQLSKLQADRGAYVKANNKETQEAMTKPSTSVDKEKPPTTTTKAITDTKDASKTGPNILLKKVPSGQATMKLMNPPTQSMAKMRVPRTVNRPQSKEPAKGTATTRPPSKEKNGPTSIEKNRPPSKDAKRPYNQAPVPNKEPTKTLTVGGTATTSTAMEISPSDFIPLSSMKTLRNQLTDVHPNQRPKFKNKLKNQLRKNYTSRFLTSPGKNSNRQFNKHQKLNTQLDNCTLGNAGKTNAGHPQPLDLNSVLRPTIGNVANINQMGNPLLNQPQKVDPSFKIPTSNLSGNQSTTSAGSSKNELRYIVIDGSNVAREHGNQLGRDQFSSRGIKLVVDHFVKRGHTEVKAFIPRFRRGTSDQNCPTMEPEILDELEKSHNLVYTPSRYVQNKLIIPYDDRFILKAAEHYNAIIVSNDNYRDLMQESREWKRLIETNLLQYSFVGDLFLIADDPMGRQGPKLQELLSCKPKNNNNANVRNNTYNNNNNFNNNNNRPNAQQQSRNFPPLMSAPVSAPGFSGKPRTQEETSVLYKKLSDVFPGRIEAIRELLKDYPHGFDITFFSHKLLSN